MIILHPYTSVRFETQIDTKKLMEKLVGKFMVVPALIDNDMVTYDDAVRIVWGKDDLLIIEQDVVPTIEQITELSSCNHNWCCYKYQIRYKDNVMVPFTVAYGLGCTKFSLDQQKKFPVELWYHQGDWKWFNLDCRITGPMVKAGQAPFVHGEVKHNRLADYYSEY